MKGSMNGDPAPYLQMKADGTDSEDVYRKALTGITDINVWR
jgi:hypothetical protein